MFYHDTESIFEYGSSQHRQAVMETSLISILRNL